MHTNLLVDAIMRQTTVLIAQLTATAGVRVPLAHLADEVFLSLSGELEDQGVPRKVIADMFGLALRSYQRRVQRMRESATDHGLTLWQAVFDHLQERQQLTRMNLLDRFDKDDPQAIAAVLNDLVTTGLASRSGTGGSTVFAITPEETRRLLARQGKEETATALIWLEVCRNPDIRAGQIASHLRLDEEIVEGCIDRLLKEGQLSCSEGGALIAKEAMVIPAGSEEGWEAAVFDHFQAVVVAITTKLRQLATGQAPTATGGTTLSFEICEGHPHAEEARALLSRIRQETDDLWEKIELENENHPIAEDRMERVVFYFGQHLAGSEVDA